MSHPEIPPAPQYPNQPPAQPPYPPAPQGDPNAYNGQPYPPQAPHTEPWTDYPTPPHHQQAIQQGRPPQQYPQYQQYGPYAPGYPAPVPPKKSRKGLIFGLIGGAVALLILGVILLGTIGAAASEASVIPNAVAKCELTDSDGVSVGDKGKSLTIDMKGEEDSTGASLDDVACLLGTLDVPDSVISQIQTTNSMQGRQVAEWEGFSSSWSYHPDSGLSMIVERESK